MSTTYNSLISLQVPTIIIYTVHIFTKTNKALLNEIILVTVYDIEN